MRASARAAEQAAPKDAPATRELVVVTTQRLTDRAIKAAKPSPDGKPYRLTDGGGLYLEVSPTGARLFRWKYYWQGKEKRLAIGIYPEVTLAMAREKRLEARRLLDAGTDPAAARKAAKEAAVASKRTFEVVAREWFVKRQGRKLDPKSEERNQRRLELHVFDHIGSTSIERLTPPDLRGVLLRAEASEKAELAHRIRTLIGQVMHYAYSMGYRPDDLSSSMKGVLGPVEVRHHPAIIEPRPFGRLLLAIDGYDGEPVVRAALKIAPLVFVRPGELLRMRWPEVDLEAKQWRLVASKTKTDLIVPLSRQVLDILEEVRVFTGPYELVFHSLRSRSRLLSDNTLNAALRYMGINTKTTHCAHGFRASARTMLEEQLGYRYDIIELQLAHQVRDPLGRSYSRVEHLEKRTEMMQAWADWTDRVKVEAAGAVVDIEAYRAKVGG